MHPFARSAKTQVIVAFSACGGADALESIPHKGNLTDKVNVICICPRYKAREAADVLAYLIARKRVALCGESVEVGTLWVHEVLSREGYVLPAGMGGWGYGVCQQWGRSGTLHNPAPRATMPSISRT